MRGDEPLFDLFDVVEHLHEGLQVIAPDFSYLYLNPVAAAQGQRDDLVGRRMVDAFPDIEASEMFAQVQRVMSDGGSHQMENVFSFPDGTRRAFELRMTRVPAGVVILSVDVTARKDAELRLRKVQRMEAVGQLAAGIAHDFNNLLLVIQGCSAFVAPAVAATPSVAADVQTIVDAATRGADLTRKLLAFSRQLPVVARAVVVQDAVSLLIGLLKRVIGEDIMVRGDVAPGVGSVHVDPSALDQILMNLAINARDAMPGGGTLNIDARRIMLGEEWAIRRGVTLKAGSYVVLSVSDTGSGIPVELQGRVFEPMFTTKAERGAGLGLATCWGLANQAGGTMTLYSEVGSGSSFSVYLPALPTAPTAPAGSHAGTSTAVAIKEGRATILVVEDQPDIRILVVRVLRAAGYKVIEATSGAEALLLMEDVGARVDLMLSDVVMPRMSGGDLTNRLAGRFPMLKVLLMSGFAANDGASGHGPLLAKPFTPNDLLVAVRDALRP